MPELRHLQKARTNLNFTISQHPTEVQRHSPSESRIVVEDVKEDSGVDSKESSYDQTMEDIVTLAESASPTTQREMRAVPPLSMATRHVAFARGLDMCLTNVVNSNGAINRTETTTGDDIRDPRCCFRFVDSAISVCDIRLAHVQSSYTHSVRPSSLCTATPFNRKGVVQAPQGQQLWMDLAQMDKTVRIGRRPILQHTAVATKTGAPVAPKDMGTRVQRRY
jgi:hypothetical protein